MEVKLSVQAEIWQQRHQVRIVISDKAVNCYSTDKSNSMRYLTKMPAAYQSYRMPSDAAKGRLDSCQTD